MCQNGWGNSCRSAASEPCWRMPSVIFVDNLSWISIIIMGARSHAVSYCFCLPLPQLLQYCVCPFLAILKNHPTCMYSSGPQRWSKLPCQTLFHVIDSYVILSPLMHDVKAWSWWSYPSVCYRMFCSQRSSQAEPGQEFFWPGKEAVRTPSESLLLPACIKA